MAPMKKAATKAGAKPMSKGGIAEALATQCEVNKSVASKLLEALAAVGTQEVKKTLTSLVGRSFKKKCAASTYWS